MERGQRREGRKGKGKERMNVKEIGEERPHAE